MSRILHEDLSGEIIGAAMNDLNELKPGLDEKLHERALVIELRQRSIQYRQIFVHNRVYPRYPRNPRFLNG